VYVWQGWEVYFFFRVLQAFKFVMIQKAEVGSLSSLWSQWKEIVVSGREKGVKHPVVIQGTSVWTHPGQV